MRTAEIVNVDGTGYIVHLLKDGNAFGIVDVRDKSVHYAQDVAENWVQGMYDLEPEEKEGSFYGYREKSANYYPGDD